MVKIDRVILTSLAIIMFMNFLDLISTAYLLNKGYSELNILHRWFFSFGKVGFFISYSFNLFFMLGLLIFVDKISPGIYKKFKNTNYDKKLKNRLFTLITISITIMEIVVISHNLII